MYFKRLVSFQMHTNGVFNSLRLIETAKQSLFHPEGEGGTPEILGGGVRPPSQNPYPIYGQTLRYWSLPYLWPDQKFDTLFMTWTLHQNPIPYPRYHWIPSSDQC